MENKEESVRIAHIIGKWIGGGVESVVMNYYRNIDKSKIQFDFICDDDSTNIPRAEIESMGGRIILIPPYQKVFKYQKELKRVLREGNYRIVHSHINALSVFPLRAAKKAGVPVRIAHSHSTTNKKEWKKNILKMVLKPFSKVYATHYFACTEHAGRWLFGDKEFDKGNVYVLNNAIDLDKFKYDEQVRIAKRKELGIDDNTIVIGHAGRFVAQKNHEFIIDVFNEVHKENKNTKLMLIGKGPLEEQIKEKVKQYGLTEAVMFLGQRPEDIHELYQAMDVFLFPSLYEGLGMVAIEAQCAGLPCICSTEVPEIAQISESFVRIDLTEQNQVWIKAILNNKEIHNRAIQIDAEMYDIKKEAQKLENSYRRMSEWKNQKE